VEVNYLEIARRGLAGYEKDERDERGAESSTPSPTAEPRPSAGDGGNVRQSDDLSGVGRLRLASSVGTQDEDVVVMEDEGERFPIF
jgi:hypothetical protein